MCCTMLCVGKKIELETAFKLTAPSRLDVNYEGRLKFVGPCSYVRDLLVIAAHSRKPALKSGTLAVTYNSEKKVSDL